MDKTVLRKKILLKRKNQSAKTKLQKDKKIISAIETDAFYKKAKNILFFMPIHGEPNTIPLIENALKLSKKVYLPKVDKTKNWLHIHQIKNLASLQHGAYKILEPHHTAPKINPEKIDLALVPGIVFDKTGSRIGFGKGYYDRLLKQTKCKKISLAYEFQIVKNIPCSEHDVKIDEIITEKRRIKT